MTDKLYKHVVINNNDFCEGNSTKLYLTVDSLDNYKLDELQNIVGGNIEIIPMGKGQLIINENGKLEGLETNFSATSIWFDHYGQSDIIVGNALYCIDDIFKDINLISYAFETCQATRRNIGAINIMEEKLDWTLYKMSEDPNLKFVGSE